MAYRKIGSFVEICNEKNIYEKYGEVLGISIDKEFMPSVANTIGTDLKKYYVVRKNNFAFNPMHVGRDERLPIALFHRGEPALVSPAYTMFKIKENENIDRDFLMLVFKTKKFDNLCWFYTDASVRGGLSWEDFQNIEIDIPNIEKQKQIVRQYNTLNNRIHILKELNKNLENITNSIYKEWIIKYKENLPDGWKLKEIKDCNLDISDGNYSSKYPSYDEFVEKGIPFIRGTDFNGKSISLENALYISKEKHGELKKGHTKKNDILITTRGYIGSIALITDDLIDVNINSQLVRINGNNIIPRCYLALSLMSSEMQNEIKTLTTGSAQQQLPIKNLMQLHIVIPTKDVLEKFERLIEPVFEYILKNDIECAKLKKMINILIEKV